MYRARDVFIDPPGPETAITLPFGTRLRGWDRGARRRSAGVRRPATGEPSRWRARRLVPLTAAPRRGARAARPRTPPVPSRPVRASRSGPTRRPRLPPFPAGIYGEPPQITFVAVLPAARRPPRWGRVRIIGQWRRRT